MWQVRKGEKKTRCTIFSFLEHYAHAVLYKLTGKNSEILRRLPLRPQKNSFQIMSSLRMPLRIYYSKKNSGTQSAKSSALLDVQQNSTRRPVEPFYWTSSRPIFLLLPWPRKLMHQPTLSTGRPVEAIFLLLDVQQKKILLDVQQNGSIGRLVEQMIWAIHTPLF